LRGAERMQAAALASSYDARWIMHYRADMDPELIDVPKKRRLKFQGRVHNIVHAEHVGRKDGIELTTSAQTAVA
jgi:head-tail adaptor